MLDGKRRLGRRVFTGLVDDLDRAPLVVARVAEMGQDPARPTRVARRSG